MIEISYLITLVIINLILLFYFKQISYFINLYDYPDKSRKIHKNKISCIGGIYLLLNISYLFVFDYLFNNLLISNLFFEFKTSKFLFFYFSLLLIFIMGIYDDRFDLKPNFKIIFLSLILLFLSSVDQDLTIKYLRFSFTDNIYDISNISIYFTIFCILVFINAFNMYDGSNLQCSSISIVIFLFFLSINSLFDYFSLTIIVCLIFFSILNYKNKLFFGDNGSLLLSFLISYFFIKYYNKELILYADLVCLFLLLPVLDLFRLFILRILNGHSPFKPDQNHIHHMIINRFNANKGKYILFSLYFIPVFFGFITKQYLLFILIQIIVYIITYLFLKKVND